MTPGERADLRLLANNSVVGRQARNLARTSQYPAVRDEWNFFLTAVGFGQGNTQNNSDPIGEIIRERIGPDFLDGIPKDRR